jgi:alpha-D-ribose 1-methylphosphonate 5-triphosphate synthase subunit PhnH
MKTSITMTSSEARARDVFVALMHALSHPGQRTSLPRNGDHGPFVQVAEALLDLECTYFTPDAGLQTSLARTGARPVACREADYVFLPEWHTSASVSLAGVSSGSHIAPEQAATVFATARFGVGERRAFAGPGIETQVVFNIGGLPADFWDWRASMQNFPLGVDIFLIDGDQVIGLPRTTGVSSRLIDHDTSRVQAQPFAWRSHRVAGNQAHAWRM